MISITSITDITSNTMTTKERSPVVYA